MVEAHHRQPVERDPVREVDERLLQRLDRAVVIEVLGIDVGDDRDGRRQVEERSIRLVRLDDDPLAPPELGIGAERVELSAHHRRRVQAGMIEDGGDEGSSGGLAVRPGDRHRILQPHQLGEHFGAADDGYAPGPRRERLGIHRPPHGARGHHHVHVASHVFGAVPDLDDPAELSEALGYLALLQVRAGHPIAEVQEELGDAAHPDASDPDEVDLHFAIAKQPGNLRALGRDVRWNVRDSIYDNQ
jgi:hypothetical protein